MPTISQTASPFVTPTLAALHSPLQALPAISRTRLVILAIMLTLLWRSWNLQLTGILLAQLHRLGRHLHFPRAPRQLQRELRVVAHIWLPLALSTGTTEPSLHSNAMKTCSRGILLERPHRHFRDASVSVCRSRSVLHSLIVIPLGSAG